MPDRPAQLEVHLHGDVVATLREKRRTGQIELTYSDAAVQRWPLRTPVLSCSLPLEPRPQDATAFLDGLLPEGQVRATLAAQRDLVASDTWGLLAEFGRDVAGAAVIGDPSRAPGDREPHVEVYDTNEHLEAAIDALPDQPLGVRADSELSLAGLQDKLLVVAVDGGCGWGRPAGGRPSTHILKPDPPRHPGLVVREAEALRLAQTVGLTTIAPELIELGDRPCLIVRRYDRADDDGATRRLHQEDLCQAVGLDARSRHGRAKYQSHGGPGFRDAATLLLERAVDPDHELAQLVGAMVFTVLIGNSDAHAKNLSLLLDPPGAVQLAPLYDTVPTMLFDKLKVRCAMWVGGVHRSLEDVTRAALIREAAGRHAWKIPAARTAELVDQWIDRIASAAHAETPTGRYVHARAAEIIRGD